MSAGDAIRIEVDHVGILGPDIDALVSIAETLGFNVYGPVELCGEDREGDVVSLEQQSAHIVFGEDYIELTAVQSKSPTHHLARFLDKPWGQRLLLLATRDIEAAAASADKAGLDPGPLQRASREVDYGAGGIAEFRWCALPPEVWPEALICYVEHRTPELVFGNAAEHPNGAVGIASLACLGNELPEGLARLAEDPAGIPLTSITAESFRDRFGTDPAAMAPLCVLGVRTRSLDETRDWFDNAALDYVESDGEIRIVAAATAFVFSEARPADR